MKKKYYYFLCIIFLFFFYSTANSQTDSIDIYDYDFNQLSKLKVSSVSKTPQVVSEIASTIYIISSTEIKEKGYFVLEDMLADLPGFQFRNIQGINSYSFQRGIPNQNNLILLLIDGIQINELNSGGYYGGGQYNLSNVERIEVIYGPASVAYGTNAISGAINIVTKNSLDKQIELNTQEGSFNTINNNFNYINSNKKKTLGVSISGMYKQSDKADLKGKAGDYNWTDLMDNFEKDYSFDLKLKAKKITFGTNFIQKESSTATSIKSVGSIYRDYGTSWNIRFINNYIRYNVNLSKKITLNSSVYNRNATVLGNTVYWVVDTAQIGYYRPNNLSGFENVFNYNLHKNFSVTSGLIMEYEQLSKSNTFSYSNSPDIKPPTPERTIIESNTLLSVFIEPRVTVLNSLFFSGGVRYDQSSVYNQVFTPRTGLSYNFKNQILRFSYAEAFRAPKPWDYTDGLGNKSLLPEKMKSLELAVTLSLLKNLKLDLVGYNNELENAITKQTVGSGYKWINEGEIKTDGFEVYLHYLTPKLKSSINYTYTNSLDSLNSFIPEISKHSGNASITYSINNMFKVNIRANCFGERENPKLIQTTNSKFIAPYIVLYGTISIINYKNFNIQLSVRNILNTEYYHTSNRSPDRYRQSQRTILLSLGYSIKS